MNTHSLCPVCHRHIEAVLFERDGVVRMLKHCPEHGQAEAVVENDAGFYRRILADRGRFTESQNMVVLDVTDKCNLACAHCYHIPDNHAENKPIHAVMADVDMTPDGFSILLGGAEPTIRRDIGEVIQEVGDKGRRVGMLSNGVRFSEPEFAARIGPRLNGIVLIGLNHRNYHGPQIHEKQLAGIGHLNAFGVRPMVGYTAEHGELKDILKEALELFAAGRIAMVRLRFGASIGRHPDLPTLTLSDHLREVIRACRELRLDYSVLTGADNTIYHQMMLVNGMPVRVIQWADEYNIVMSELARGPWAKFYDGPISNFVHQIILRDGVVNKKLPVLDAVPEIYTLPYCAREARSAVAPGWNVLPHHARQS